MFHPAFSLRLRRFGFAKFSLVPSFFGSLGCLPRFISLLVSKPGFFTRLSDADRSRVVIRNIPSHEPVGDPVRGRRIHFVSGPVRIRTVIITIPGIRLPSPGIMKRMEYHLPARTIPVRVVPRDEQSRPHNHDWAVNIAVWASNIVSFDCIVDYGRVLDDRSVLYVDRYSFGNLAPLIIKVDGLLDT